MGREKTSIRLTGWGLFREAFVSGRGMVARRFVFATVMAVCVVVAGLVLASVPALAEVCVNERFRQGPSAALPDCRAYEMVSPPNKNGGEVDGGVLFDSIPTPGQAAVDGEAVTYGSSTTFLGTGADSGELTSQYLSKRTVSGWQTQAITPVQQEPKGDLEPSTNEPQFSLFQGFNENLTDGFLLAWNPQPVASAPAGYFNPYLRNNNDGSYSLLSSEARPAWPSPGVGPVEFFIEGYSSLYAGMSADGQYVIFEANEALTAEAVPKHDNLYEWSAGRPLELVSVLPDGTVCACGQEYPDRPGLKFGAEVGSARNEGTVNDAFNYSGALSSNGTRAFWSGDGKVYMHEIVGSGARTVEVSASQKGVGGSGHGVYWTANRSGSLVYFTSSEELTNDSTASSGAEDLYQYDTETGVLTDLTVDEHAGESAAVQGVLGSGESEGVGYVYFVAHGVLGSGGKQGANNLYVSHAGEVTWIATLGTVKGETADFSEEAVAERTSRVSPNGRLVAFESEEQLTGYDNAPTSGECPQPRLEEFGYQPPYANDDKGRCMEVFEYDAQSGRLSCASCDPHGLPPTGESIVPEASHLLNPIFGWQSSTVQQRYLLDDGRLFFDSEDALLAQATDGKQNVYEYEPEGMGGCAATGTGSCLYLVSTGTSSADSAFMDASADGRDVFFTTRQQLVPEDGDESIDVYDAREDGGFTQASLPPCAGEACKPAVTSAPAIYGAPTSATFTGNGNSTPSVAASPKAKAKSKAKTARCKKGDVRKKSRCVGKVKAKKSNDRKGSR